MEIKASVLITLSLFLPLSQSARFFRNDLPHVQIIEIYTIETTKVENGEAHRIIEKSPNSNILVGEDVEPASKLVLECEAGYPVQWVYNGDGMPEYSTNTSSTKASTNITRPGPPVFTASISLGFGRRIGAADAGKYTCRSLQNPSLSVFYNLYVSDKKLFTNLGGEEIYYRRTDASARIPCGVTNPNAVVSLQKSINGLVQCPLNESITYDATKGFDLKISNYFDPAGTYVCTAGYNDTFEVVRYTLIPENTAASTSPSRTCQRNDDCPENQACLNQGRSGYNCASPCSVACGSNTKCETINRVPRCYCLPGYIGDAYKGCHFAQPRPDKLETDPCNPNPCGQNTVCERLNGAARCSCSQGYQGDPYVRCFKRDVCSPNPCGPNSQCSYTNGYASCLCQTGYYGQPPYCRSECEMDRHCAGDRVCSYGTCRNPCEGACNQFSNTVCRVINRRAVCARIQTRCPSGYYGRDCLSLVTKTEPIVPIVGADDTRVSTTPCMPFPCGEKAECIVKDMKKSTFNTTSSQVALCQCPPKFTGSADIECYPVEEQLARNDSIELETTGSPNNESEKSECSPACGRNAICTEKNVCTCGPLYKGDPYKDCTTMDSITDDTKNCGINTIAIVSESGGKSMCACPVGHTGIPTIECHKIINGTETPVKGTGTDPCASSPCGDNALCVITSEGLTECSCIESFKGDPQIGCEKNCTSNNDCPDSHICHEISSKCVNPCHPDNLQFFVLCGRDAECKVKNHAPYCYCPESLPHGSPNVHCKEKSWMPNHLKSNSTCENAKKLKCGPNTACKRFHDSAEYCVCLPGFFGDPNEDGCQEGLQCRKNNHCRNDEECMNGKCLSVCRHKDQCGPLAGCRAENHKPVCICHIGTIKNFSGECETAKGALAERMLFYRSFEDI